MKPKALGINFISIMGYDIHSVGNIYTTILDMKQSASSKILSILFRGDFKTTLEKIATDEYYVAFIKNNLNDLMNLIPDKKLSHVIGQIFQMFVTYNKELGDWIISKLVDINCGSKQVTLLYTLTKCNPKDFLGRLQIIKNFIFDQCHSLSQQEKVDFDTIVKIKPYMDTFTDLVSIYSKNLQIDSWWDEIFSKSERDQQKLYSIHEFIDKKRSECLNATMNNFTEILRLMQFSNQFESKNKDKAMSFLNNFILPFIVYGKIVDTVTKSELSPTQIVKEYLLKNKEEFYKYNLASNIIANLNKEEGSDEVMEWKSEIISTLETLNPENEGEEENYINVLTFWINCCNNEDFRIKMSQDGIGLKLYRVITRLNIKKPTMMTLTIKKLVINLIIKFTIGYEENENTLAKSIIEDLETLKDKRDIEFVNNILTPLLKAENKVPVSFDFINESAKTYYTFSGSIEQCSEAPKSDNFLSRPEFAGVLKNMKEVIDSKFNLHKLIVSKWKSIFTTTGTTTLTDFENLMKILEGKSS